ncbi:MAG: UDP-glucose--hexose-1-phosphate uridylyltransferase [Chloroflexota bacterium]|nr:MAG: UDP-glucose--hexose-1-phosphate uridylyltransferase [Chloroflexota bacterium]
MKMNSPHRRFNPLTNEWVLVSPQRTQRPWLGQVEKTPQEHLPRYDPNCYLCPGNARAGGVKNPHYDATFVFDNDFAALIPDAGENETAFAPHTAPLLRAEPMPGKCRVVCFHPRHDLTLSLMTTPEIETIIHTWTRETNSLGALEYVNYVQVFENKGAAMGASNPHPHSQIWASRQIPNEPALEFFAEEKYSLESDGCLLCDYLRVERERGERIVSVNEQFTVIVPYWAVWPFEVLLLSNRHCGALADLNAREVTALADILKKLTTRYDNLFQVPFPYSMGFHQTPTDGSAYPAHHFHAHYYPPLLRSASVRKFMVGYELLAMPQRDLTPESAAERLRELSEVHYSSQA